ncbi:MAG: AMP-binding protein [Chloroflexota bacterium]|nr:AMP-binding protein [Chloroflexota bacterium]
MTVGAPPNGPFDERERWPVERWRELQKLRLREVTALAYRDLPFYRDRLDDAGITPADVHGTEDFARLPLLTKRQVVSDQARRGSYAVGMESVEGAGPKAFGMTSGSLGTVLLAYPDSWRVATGEAAARAYWWAGLRPGMQMLVAAPAWHAMAMRQTYVAQRLAARCVMPWGTFLPTFAGRFLDALRDVRPEFVCLFLPMLYSMLAECRKRETPPSEAFSSVRSLLLGGAPITPAGRAQLRSELGVDDVFDSAGSSEGLLSGECSAHNGLHYFVDVCYVEIVDPVTRQPLPPGRRGSMVVTSLVPHGSIYLRYDTEDVAEILPGDCSCGCSWPRLRIYDRRANQVDVGGRTVMWHDVRTCLDRFPEMVGVSCALIRGDGESSVLHLMLERPAAGRDDGLEARVEQVLRGSLRVEPRLEWVSELPARWKGVTVIDEQDWRGHHG